MDFSQTKSFNEAIKAEYGEYYLKYSYAMLAVDMLIQLRVLREHKFETWIDDRKKRHIEAEARFRIFKRQYLSEIYYYFLKIFAPFFFKNRKFTVHSSIDETIFPGFPSVLKELTNQKGWVLINLGVFSLRNLIDLMTLKKVSPYRCFLSLKTKRQIKKFISDDDTTLTSLLNNKSFMSHLDVLVKNDVERTKKLIELLKVNLFINSGDAEAFSQVLNKACKSSEIKTISIAHGYILNTVLMGINPVRSNILILWTEKQRLDISRAVSEEVSKRLKYIGFPKFFKTQEGLDKDINDCLIAMSHVDGILEDPALTVGFRNVILELKKIFKKVRIRLHPYERLGFERIYTFFKDLGVEISTLSLEEDLKSSSHVIGASTSVLVEASAAGKKVFEIEEFAHPSSSLEGVISIKCSEIHNLIEMEGNAEHEGQLKWNREKLLTNLSNLIQETQKKENNL